MNNEDEYVISNLMKNGEIDQQIVQKSKERMKNVVKQLSLLYLITFMNEMKIEEYKMKIKNESTILNYIEYITDSFF